MDTNEQPVKAKRTTKNSVFLNLFGDKKYLLELYKTLHPEDTDATEDDLDIVTIENILTDNLYNDLGIMAHGNRLLLLMEAQATWTSNILVRVLMYLAQSYHEYCEWTSQSLYKSKKVKIPKPDMKDVQRETAEEAAKKMFKKGMSFDDIADCFPILTYEELKKIEADTLAFA
jgi:hypothetical protein